MKRLIAITALALTVSSPAMAWGDREQGILTGIILKSVLDHATQPQHQPVPVPPPQVHNHYHNDYSVKRCGYQENVFRNGYTTVVEKRNSCTGQLIERREYYR